MFKKHTFILLALFRASIFTLQRSHLFFFTLSSFWYNQLFHLVWRPISDKIYKKKKILFSSVKFQLMQNMYRNYEICLRSINQQKKIINSWKKPINRNFDGKFYNQLVETKAIVCQYMMKFFFLIRCSHNFFFSKTNVKQI